MYDFTFLTPDRGAGFVKRLEAEGLAVSVARDPMAEEATTISIPDDIPDALTDRIEEWYEEETQAAEAELFRDGRAEATISAGVWVTLENGQSSFAPIAPSIMSRMLSALSPDEVGEFVDRVVRAAEHPNDTPVCARRED
ncbi:hypothetical protein [Guyparkeria halopsychrophila]|uniref:hypothetical protein n=1 Tax=Guyparkeria halopsychrophila TaxID=3139421 RepID=UPI0037C531FD